jgi:hypothetical protein
MPRLSPTSAAGTSPSRPAGARYPNFDFIRLVAASSVIFSHAFQISEGTDENEPRTDTIGCIFVLKPGPGSGAKRNALKAPAPSGYKLAGI